MQNRQRILVQCIATAAAEMGASVTTHCDDWILAITLNSRTLHIVGYDFPLNTATAKLIAQDKTALSEVLAAANIPHIEHRIVHHPKMAEYVPHAGNWPWLTDYLRLHRRVVVKPNEGTGGNDVYRASTLLELEHALSTVHAKTRAAVVCPYVDIAHEYRLIVLNGTVQLCYRKLRPTVTGDGRRSLAQLALAQLASVDSARPLLAALRQTPWDDPDFSLVPPAGTLMPINWRHNLGQGASVEVIPPTSPLFVPLESLARSAAAAVGLGFCSVDIVESPNHPPRVLEINAGIMMESLARQLDGGMALATTIYTRALRSMFALPA
jgi:glutathione synthase/RimK-type ligase-like ATP-grasp enzyme